jgi:hypothetical protein
MINSLCNSVYHVVESKTSNSNTSIFFEYSVLRCSNLKMFVHFGEFCFTLWLYKFISNLLIQIKAGDVNAERQERIAPLPNVFRNGTCRNLAVDQAE